MKHRWKKAEHEMAWVPIRGPHGMVASPMMFCEACGEMCWEHVTAEVDAVEECKGRAAASTQWGDRIATLNGGKELMP